MALIGGLQLKTGRREKSSPELEAAVRAKLEAVREEIVARDFPNQHFLTGNVILADNVIDILAKRARLITSIDALLQETRWLQASQFALKLSSSWCLWRATSFGFFGSWIKYCHW